MGSARRQGGMEESVRHRSKASQEPSAVRNGAAGGGSSRGRVGRVRLFDALRGFSVVSMVAFHLCYDLRFLSHLPLVWFAPPLQDMWRASISWVFVFIAGCMCSFSRNNLKRAGVYLGVALLVFVATTAAAVDDPISFGIIFCMGACTFVEWVLERLGCSPRGYVAAAILFLAFVLCLGVPRGSIGIGPLALKVPAGLYSTPWLSWLGFPGPGFVSGDYYPVLPYLLLYLCGSSCCARWRRKGFPARLYEPLCRPLEFVGRHSLLVYVVHQPILLLLTGNL